MKEIVNRNIDVKGHSGEISDRNEQHVIVNWKKGESRHEVAKNLATLCSGVLWKAEIASDKLDI